MPSHSQVSVGETRFKVVFIFKELDYLVDLQLASTLGFDRVVEQGHSTCRLCFAFRRVLTLDEVKYPWCRPRG